MKVSEELFKILEESDVKQIGTDTQVDEFSKKLKLTEHVKLLVAFSFNKNNNSLIGHNLYYFILKLIL